MTRVTRPSFRDAFPILYSRDVERALRFYRDLLGFEVAYRWPDAGPIEYAFMRLGASALGIGRGSEAQAILGGLDLARAPRGEICVYVDDTVRHLVDNGARVLVAPGDRPWGERLAYVQDPDGNPV